MGGHENHLERLCETCAEVGALFEDASPVVRARMQLLADRTETVADCTRIAGLARKVFDYYDGREPDARFTEIEKHIVVIGSVFSDVGKTGPAHADADGQTLIVDMFSVEGVRDDKQPVAEFFESYFPADAEARKDRFSALGLDPKMPMRAFWNLHSGWTLEILRDAGLPAEAVAAAATHHLLDDVNPEEIVAEDGRFSISFGENERFDRAEKLVILLDKYDALIRRGGRTHEQAIAWLAERLQRHPTFATDEEFATLLRNVDLALGDHAAGSTTETRG